MSRPRSVLVCPRCRVRPAETSSPPRGLCLHCYNDTKAANEPPVCVCDEPEPDGIGECRHCRRPYKPHHAGLMRARATWMP
jgi:hypothetical protein